MSNFLVAAVNSTVTTVSYGNMKKNWDFELKFIREKLYVIVQSIMIIHLYFTIRKIIGDRLFHSLSIN